MKKTGYSLIIALTFLIASPAFALSLGDAKQQGLVGEQHDGLLGSVGAESKEVRALINSINSKRMAAYTNIAAKNGTNVDTVKKLAGKKAIEKTPSGQYVKPSGSWMRAP